MAGLSRPAQIIKSLIQPVKKEFRYLYRNSLKIMHPQGLEPWTP